MEKEAPPANDLGAHEKSRSGQCLAFHAGEQAHAGTSWDGIPDHDEPKFKARVVAYFFAVPNSEKERVSRLSLFSTETPWGLLKPGIRDYQVEDNRSLRYS